MNEKGKGGKRCSLLGWTCPIHHLTIRKAAERRADEANPLLSHSLLPLGDEKPWGILCFGHLWWDDLNGEEGKQNNTFTKQHRISAK